MPETTRPIRPAAVAGRFYPGNPHELWNQVHRHLGAVNPHHAVGILVPHAGYVYSGGVAGKVFAAVAVPRRVVVIGPNHTGRGPRISVADHSAFALPGASVPVDRQLAEHIVRAVAGATLDVTAHTREHAIEVELPFLVAREPAVAVVPIVLSDMDADAAIGLGQTLHEVISRIGGEVLVVASSDMSHFLSDAETRRVDKLALEPLLRLDPRGLHDTVRKHGITMCGYVPATVMLSYAQAAGARAPVLVDYATSGDAMGDRDRVVGYAGVVVP